MDALNRVIHTEKVSFGNLCIGRIDLHEHFATVRWAVDQKLSLKAARTTFRYVDGKTIVMEPKVQ